MDEDDILAALASLSSYGISSKGLAWISDVGSGSFLRFFDGEVLGDLVGSNAGGCRFIEAVYGAGKTHLLDLLEQAGQARNMVVARADLSHGVSLEDWKTFVIYLLENMTLRTANGEARSLPDILRLLGPDSATRISEGLIGCASHPGFANAMQLVAGGSVDTGDAEELLSAYLCGERITASRLRAAGVLRVKDPLSARNAEQVIDTVLAGLGAATGGVLLLVDENEQTLSTRSYSPPRRIVRAANLIRRLIDACAAGQLRRFVAVFAVLPGFLGRCASAYGALGQRVERPKILVDTPVWRWPVMELGHLTDVATPEEFAELFVERLVDLASRFDANPPDLRQGLTAAAREELERHAGAGYRRPLVKRLAAMTLQEIES